ncbi:hypothetical protein VTO42DRAFT_7245 [Malbranchea cinnamomea]
MAAGHNHIDKEDFLYLYPPARAQAFSQANICSRFASTGLRPVNAERVLSKITFQLHTPTPLPVASPLSSPSLQTPQNPRQLQHHLQTLQKSLRKRDISSSPVCHIDRLERAAQVSMATNLLPQQEIKLLQAENERQTRKRARTRAILGTQPLMNVQQGRDQLQQQNKQHTRQDAAAGQGAQQRAPRRCSGCNNTGHTVRRCPSR